MNSENAAEKSPRKKNLLQSGIIFTAISFLTGLGNLGFQIVMGHHLKKPGEYGSANSAINGFMTLLGLLPSVAIFAVTHYIAHFNAIGDRARLQGLLIGCRNFLFHLTIFGSLLAIVVIEPLSKFFHYNESLMLVTLATTILGIWAALPTALCQGLAWFKRLALIGFLMMLLRVTFGWFITLKWPSPETAVAASAFALLANFILLFWRKELALHGEPVSPWNHEFTLYLIVSAACVVGNYCFTQGDLMVMQKYFSGVDRDNYTAAERLAFALPTTVGPLLTVLFTSRSGARSGNAVTDQLKLLALFVFGLIFGTAALIVLRHFCVKLILGETSTEAEAMVARLAITLSFAGLLQALAFWSLASRWPKISIFYGVLGMIYWAILLVVGKTPAALLQIMPVAAGISFAILFLFWFVTMQRHRHAVQS